MIRTRWKVKENWRRLLAELVIIAVGVGVALTVDNWNETRKERIAEREYLRGIAADLEETAFGLERASDAAVENRAALERLIGVANGGAPPAARDMAIDLVLATYLSLPRLTIVTFEELVSTGSLRILRDAQFKRALAKLLGEFRARSQWYENYRRIEYTTEIALRGLAPIEVRTEGRAALERPDVMARFDTEAVAAALRNDREIIAILEDSVWTQARVVSLAEDLLLRIDELRTMLAEMDLD
jgi:uncharacterized membrane protein